MNPFSDMKVFNDYILADIDKSNNKTNMPIIHLRVIDAILRCIIRSIMSFLSNQSDIHR